MWRASSRRPTPCRSSTSCVTTSPRPACPRPTRSPTPRIPSGNSSGCRASLKTDPTRLTIHALIDAYRAGDTTPTAATEAYLARIAAHDEKLGAFLTVTRDEALSEARVSDERYRKGMPRGPLDGVPVALKDVFSTRRGGTTCGSKILSTFVPPYDATVVTRLRDARAVVLGKTNMDEFAMGSSTEHSAFKPTHNPWDLARVPGGSSGGSAAAVAGDLAAAALCTDNGRSGRQPTAVYVTVCPQTCFT